MSATTRLIVAMHTASGPKGRYVTRWLELAQTDSALREAFRQVFGKRLPLPQRLGQWLSERLGTHGELLLEGRYKTRRKAWAYRVITPTEAAERNAAREAAELQREALSAEMVRAAADRELERIAARVVRKQERQREAAKKLSVHIEVMPASLPVEHVYETHVDSDGRVTRKPVTDPRTGEPVKRTLQPSVAPEKEPEPQPMTRVEQMRARYLKHHQGGVLSDRDFGFCDPGGVVSANRIRQNQPTDFLWWSKDL